MKRLYNGNEMRKKLSEHIWCNYKTQIAASSMWEVSATWVSAVLRGQKPLTKRMLEELGFEKVVMYRRKGKE